MYSFVVFCKNQVAEKKAKKKRKDEKTVEGEKKRTALGRSKLEGRAERG